MTHTRRFYRHTAPSWGTAFNVKHHASDLHILADSDLHDAAYRVLVQVREELDGHIKEHQDFLYSLSPVDQPADCPEIAAMMYRASQLTGTGPMAAVAGAIAELTGKELLKHSSAVIVENGGDIWLSVPDPVIIAIYAKNIYFRDNIAVRLDPRQMPCSVCTSAPKLGHSLSFGKADSVTIIAESGALADAAATMTCNMVQEENDMESALDRALSVPGVTAGLIIFRDKLALQGDLELAPPR
ncbi:MAG TPA: UPF0280 family protein [Spirochaetota bacterium]|nr:UPF0280 family protein [Spirochaetota bacterium]